MIDIHTTEDKDTLDVIREMELAHQLHTDGFTLDIMNKILTLNAKLSYDFQKHPDKIVAKGKKPYEKISLYDYMEILGHLGKNKELTKYYYISGLLVNPKIKKNGLTFFGISMILEANKEFKARYIYKILTNDNALKYDIAYSIAQKIEFTREEYQAKLMFILCEKLNPRKKDIPTPDINNYILTILEISDSEIANLVHEFLNTNQVITQSSILCATTIAQASTSQEANELYNYFQHHKLTRLTKKTLENKTNGINMPITIPTGKGRIRKK